ncbi:MAG: hypothetical protein K8T20_01345 [Planctomycetes bacterium]|nr:hypothetical protein [Planctomycetota bacterium]
MSSAKPERSTVIYRPATPKPPGRQGMRALWYLGFLLCAGAAYAGTIAWFAHRERTESDERVRALRGFALASFGARNEVVPGSGVALPDASRLGGELRALLEIRLRGLKGKSFDCSVPAPSAYEPLKADPRREFVAVPAGTRVLDLHDAATCIALRAMHGTDNLLRVLATFSVRPGPRPVLAIRIEASVFGKDARLIWTRIFTETEAFDAPPADQRADPLLMAFRVASFRATDSVAAALESR